MDIAYFDNAATTYIKPQEVHDFMHEFYSANSINIGRGQHSLLSEGNNIIYKTRKMLLELFGANNEYEAVFSATATEAINVILQGQQWSKGDIVYLSPFEHNAVYRTIIHLQNIFGFKIEKLSFNNQSLELDLDAIKYQFSFNAPKFVIASHVSNVFGNIIDINKLGQLAKSYNAKVMIDCAQSAGLLETNIVDCQADYMVFAGHKTLYGPFGCSGFICKKTAAPLPLIYGGTGIESAREDMPENLPTRYEAGSVNIMAIAGLYKSLEWINKTGRETIFLVENENYNKLYNLLSKYDLIKVIGKGKNSTSIVSCVFDGYSPDSIANILSQHGVIVRSGLQCAPLAHKALGTFPEGTVRFSVSYFTKDEDFNNLNIVLAIIDENQH